MPKFLESLPMLLSRTLDGIMPRYRSLFQAHGLTDQQWRVLRLPLVPVSYTHIRAHETVLDFVWRLLLEKKKKIKKKRT